MDWGVHSLKEPLQGQVKVRGRREPAQELLPWRMGAGVDPLPVDVPVARPRLPPLPLLLQPLLPPPAKKKGNSPMWGSHGLSLNSTVTHDFWLRRPMQ